MSSRSTFVPWLLGAAFAAACSSDADRPAVLPSEPNRARIAGGAVDVCHNPTGAAQPMSVAPTDIQAHLDHGDYVAGLVADPHTTLSGDNIHFRRITDALAFATAGRQSRGETATAACRITISVAAETYRGSFAVSSDPTVERFPLLVNAPRIALQGGLHLLTDASGRATAVGDNVVNVATLQPTTGLVVATQAIFIVTDRSDGSRGDSTVITGFALQSGHVGTDNVAGGFGILSLRAHDLVVHDNRFEPLFTSGMDLRASTARVENNYAGPFGTGCAFCLAGPGAYVVQNNTISHGGAVGVFVVSAVGLPVPAGVDPFVVPSAATVTATIHNNDVRGNLTGGAPNNFIIGNGIRVTSLGTQAPNVDGTVDVTATGNTLSDNAFAMTVDAGFPPSGVPLHGTVSVTSSANVMSPSCEGTVLVSLQRNTKALGLPTPAAVGGTLSNSTYTLNMSDVAPADLWYDNPTGQGNSLTFGGEALTGTRQFYSNPCPVPIVPTSAWIGLKNSDDVGTKFDLRVELLKNDALITVGQINGVAGGSSGFNNAVLRTMTATMSANQTFAPGDMLAVRLSVRIAEGVPGHTSGTARLWYGDAGADSRASVIANGATRLLYLLPGGALGSSPGTTRTFGDVLVNRTKDGNMFKPFGTWTMTF